MITGGCPAYGEGITFLPLREALLEAAEDGDIPALLEREGVAGADAGSILGAIGLRPQQGSPDGLFLAARRMFEALAAIRPLVVVFDDLHWAEPTLLDLIEFVGRSAAGPILLVVLARPELIEDHPEWAATDPRAQLLLLDPLPSEDIEALIEDRAGRYPSGREREQARADGPRKPPLRGAIARSARRSRDRGDPGSTAWPVGNAPGPARAG